MNGITIYEFDTLLAADPGCVQIVDAHYVPRNVYDWLENQCLEISEAGTASWLRLAQRRGRRVLQVTSFVGVIRAPGGFQIEVLPKVGKAIGGGAKEARQLLVEMLCCLHGFRHVQIESARILATRMPLLEIFVAEFLRAVESIVKRGLRGDYASRQGNLFAMRGKLLMASHLRQNLHRADRFFTEHDEFSVDRPENRLLHSALRRVLMISSSRTSQQIARELLFVVSDVPESAQPRVDFQRVRLDRGMGCYADALAWSRLILNEESPLTGIGVHQSPSLLFPMEAVFEAFVAKHLAKQIPRASILKTQVQSRHMVRHRERNWFRLKPDLLLCDPKGIGLVLDTKWKLLDCKAEGSGEKYGLAQNDFYQLQAYGQSYLSGRGDVILIYPKTASFNVPLKVFEFSALSDLRLWVLPFCLDSRRLEFLKDASFAEMFTKRGAET